MPNSGKVERDPRVDPKAGDVFQKQCAVVEITIAGADSFSYKIEGWCDDMRLLMPHWNEPWLPPFRRWAKDAEVIHAS